MQQKLRSTPIYAVLKRIYNKNVVATQELCNAVQAKTSKEQQPYFLISIANILMTEKSDDFKYQTIDHHISVYKRYNDKILVLSAYHYTAAIIIQDQRYTLHGYFNKFGQLLDVRVKDSRDQPFNELDKWNSLFRRNCTQYTSDILSEIFNIIDSVTNNIDKELHALSTNIDQISEILYGENSDQNTIESNSILYKKTIKNFIELQNELNGISLYPNQSNINFLHEFLKNYKVPASTIKSKLQDPSKKQRPPKTSSAEYQKSATNVKKSFSEKYITLVPTIPLDIQEMLKRIENCEKVTSADTILKQHSLLRECASRMEEVPDSIAMDIFIKQNSLNKKVKIAILMFITIGDTVSVNKLLPIVTTISQSMLCTAAEKNPQALVSLLKFYMGPKKISKLLIPHSGIYSDLTTDETLPTPSLAALLQFGCDPNAVDVFGRSLLYIAVTLDDIHRVRMLLDAGTNINQHSTKKTHRIALIPEVICKDTNVSDREIKSIEKIASKEMKNRMSSFHKRFPLISSTPIMAAVQKRSLPIVRLLKERGCDFSLMSDEGMNAYSVALLRPIDNPQFTLNEVLITFLINECGLGINMMHGNNNQKKPALFHLVQYKVFVPEISKDIEVLLKFNADPNVLCECTHPDGTVVMVSSFTKAIQQQYYDLAELMLNKSRIRISQDDILSACDVVKLFTPDYLDQFKRVCINHIQRFTPIPMMTDVRNAFFNSTDSVELPSPSVEHRK